MAGIIAKFKITHGGESGVLVFVVTTARIWYLESPLKWFPNYGSWVQVQNATKFRSWNMTRLVDLDGDYVAEWPSPPYPLGMKSRGELMKSWGPIQYDSGEQFDVEVVQGSGTSKFKIRERADLTVSYSFGQVEFASFEIQNPASGSSSLYRYKGIGLGVSTPLPKIPNVGKPNIPGGVSNTGDWNDFDAPAFMTEADFEGGMTIQTPVNVGLGSSVSYNIVDVHANVYGFGVDIHINGFSTGNTFSLPSAGFTSGTLSLAEDKPQHRSCGKVICA